MDRFFIIQRLLTKNDFAITLWKAAAKERNLLLQRSVCLKLVKVDSNHVFAHRKVKTEMKDVDEKASVDLKIEETRRNLFHVNVSESDCSEVETETSKVKKKTCADIDLIIVEDVTAYSTS